MIPKNAAILRSDLKVGEQPTRTYRIDHEGSRIRGYADGRQAMEQAVFKILSTERYQYIMYSWNYGVELKDLFGEPVSYVCPELERRIREALLWDSRIRDVTDFVFDTSRKGSVHVCFHVQTIYGEIKAEKEVKI